MCCKTHAFYARLQCGWPKTMRTLCLLFCVIISCLCFLLILIARPATAMRGKLFLRLQSLTHTLTHMARIRNQRAAICSYWKTRAICAICSHAAAATAAATATAAAATLTPMWAAQPLPTQRQRLRWTPTANSFHTRTLVRSHSIKRSTNNKRVPVHTVPQVVWSQLIKLSKKLLLLLHIIIAIFCWHF